MRKVLYGFLMMTLLMTVAGSYHSSAETRSEVIPLERAKSHSIEHKRPAIDFFEGALLGNGGLGTVVCTRPDAVVIYLGHNDVWDIRLSEKNIGRTGTFQDIFDEVMAMPDTLENLTDVKWFKNYIEAMREDYAKPYPRPFPCGSVILWFDRRKAELLGHRVNIDRGVCEIDFLIDGETRHLEIFTDMQMDRLWGRMIDSSGSPVEAPFVYASLIPDPATPKELPRFETIRMPEVSRLAFRQILPKQELQSSEDYKPSPRDNAFVTSLTLSSSIDNSAVGKERENTGLGIIPAEKSKDALSLACGEGDFSFCIQLDHFKGQEYSEAAAAKAVAMPSLAPSEYQNAADASARIWGDYWSKSGVALDDNILERTWYHNLYFLRCSLKKGYTCPGLFANWSFKNIGTAWHGDYHMNYNTQQAFWATFSSNHTELHEPYVEMVERYLLPVSRLWARNYYKMRGAFFPHSAYPVPMRIMPYPVPTWGWEVFETPWTVQSLWWHYSYTLDEDYLRNRAFGTIKEAVLFLVDYMKRPDARKGKWDDGLYHIMPSVPPELYGLRPGFDKNYDTIADLTLTRFVFNAYLEACEILAIESAEKELMADVRDILAHFPEYPTAESSIGEVYVSVEGEEPDIVYNVPASTMTVFPGEHHGLHSPKEDYDLALRTLKNQQNEGGNELVFLNLQAARLGVLDLEKFARQINYCLLPNGSCTDKVLQIHGRYTNNTPYDFMAPMGIWFENFGLPAVINECMMQSYNGEIRLFPNWPGDKDAEFRTLRAKGAFLVSAKRQNGVLEWVEILSEKGGELTVINPWEGAFTIERDGHKETARGGKITFTTAPNERIVMRQAR